MTGVRKFTSSFFFLNKSAVSSISLGSIVIFASCVIHLPLIVVPLDVHPPLFFPGNHFFFSIPVSRLLVFLFLILARAFL